MSIKKEYTLLFNTITDLIEELEQMKQRLIQVQQQAEELFISREEPNETPRPL